MNLCDEWLGIDAGLEFNRPTQIWTFPIETVSQSEGGFELVHQAVCVQPHWHVNGDADGRWATVIQLTLDTSLAEQRRSPMQSAVLGALVIGLQLRQWVGSLSETRIRFSERRGHPPTPNARRNRRPIDRRNEFRLTEFHFGQYRRHRSHL